MGWIFLNSGIFVLYASKGERETSNQESDQAGGTEMRGGGRERGGVGGVLKGWGQQRGGVGGVLKGGGGSKIII